MAKKNIILVSLVVLLGGAYIYWFTDWFRSPTVGISFRPRTERGRQGTPASFSASFIFNTRTNIVLTEIKVVSAAELKTNKYAHAYWHLISDRGSAPTKGIVYGEMVKGMKPSVPKMKAEALDPGVEYLLTVQAGERQGVQPFTLPGKKAP